MAGRLVLSPEVGWLSCPVETVPRTPASLRVVGCAPESDTGWGVSSRRETLALWSPRVRGSIRSLACLEQMLRPASSSMETLRSLYPLGGGSRCVRHGNPVPLVAGVVLPSPPL